MKASVICSVEECGFPEFVFDGNIETNFPLIRQLGYTGVELALSDPCNTNIKWLKGLLDKNKLKVTNTGTGELLGRGLFLTSADKNIRLRCLDKLAEYVDFSHEVGGSLSIGCVRGPELGQPFGEDKQLWLTEGISNINKYAVERNVQLLVEPLADKYIGSINTLSDGITLLNQVGSDNIRLLLDTYNLWMMGEDVPQALRTAGDLIGHIHIADSNRQYPGAGEIDFTQVFQALRDVGYDGFLSLEALPKPAPLDCAKKTIEFISNYWSR